MSRESQKKPDAETPLDRALWQISIIDLDSLSLNDRLKAVASIFLAALDDFLQGGGAQVIGQEALSIYQSAAREIPDLAADIRGLSREQLGNFIDNIFLPCRDPAQATERAQMQKQAVRDINGADLVLVARALQSILPPALESLLAARGLIDTTPDATWAKNLIRTIAQATTSEIARHHIAAAQAFPREQAIDRLHDITQAMTGEKLTTLFNHIGGHYPAQDFVKLAVDALGVLRHVLEDVARHGVPARMTPAAQADLAAWGAQAHRFLTVTEDALQAAGLRDDIYGLVTLLLPSLPLPAAAPDPQAQQNADAGGKDVEKPKNSNPPPSPAP